MIHLKGVMLMESEWDWRWTQRIKYKIREKKGIRKNDKQKESRLSYKQLGDQYECGMWRAFRRSSSSFRRGI